MIMRIMTRMPSMPMQIIKEKMARYILTPSQINGALMAMERGGNL